MKRRLSVGVTISDVARLAGVGRGTVSRVLNDRANVDPATREKVLAAIKALDFVPSQTARRLSLRRTQTIAVIIPFLTRPSAVERLSGIEQTLAASGYDPIVFNIETAERRLAVFRDLPRPERMDGLIIVSLSPHPAELERIERSGLPTVLVDAHHRALPRVVGNDVLGGRLAAQHVINLGHRRIAFLGDIPRVALAFTSSRLRLSGVRQTLRANGIGLPPSRVGIGEHSRQTGGGDGHPDAERGRPADRDHLRQRHPGGGGARGGRTPRAQRPGRRVGDGIRRPGDGRSPGVDDDPPAAVRIRRARRRAVAQVARRRPGRAVARGPGHQPRGSPFDRDGAVRTG